MKLSSKAHYGLNACYLLAKNYPDRTASARALEEELAVSAKYLEQMMRLLTARDVVKATRGAAGGYALARPPEEITVGAVVRALEDDMDFIRCATQETPCRNCASAAVWRKLYKGINEVLDGMTLRDMLEGEIE